MGVLVLHSSLDHARIILRTRRLRHTILMEVMGALGVQRHMVRALEVRTAIKKEKTYKNCTAIRQFLRETDHLWSKSSSVKYRRAFVSEK